MPRRGENIYKRKDGRWEGRYMKGHNEKKAKYGYVYAKTYREVKEKLNIAVQIFSENSSVLQNNRCQTHFDYIAEEWLIFMRPYLKESSIVKYQNILKNYLLPQYKSIPISAITQESFYNFLNQLFYSGGSNHQGLSSKTIESIFSVTKSIFKYAHEIHKIPVDNIQNIRTRQFSKTLRILSITEQQHLHVYLVQNLTLSNLGILLCLYTGIRIGELCALKWEDISFEEQYLYISKTMQRVQLFDNSKSKTYISISKPKSECSIRKIPIPDSIFQFLIDFRGNEQEYFLTGSTTKFIEPRTMQNRFKKILHICNIKDANFHSLRHTFATRCIELGFDYKSLSEILGHSNVNITLNRYVHPSMELKQKNMNLLSDRFPVK